MFWLKNIGTIYSSLKKFRYLGINLTKDIKDLLNVNYKILTKVIQDVTNGKIFHVHGFEKHNQGVYTIQSNLYIQYNPKVTNIPYRLKKKVILMFICNMKEPKHSKQS